MTLSRSRVGRRELRLRIVEATARLLHERGAAGVTTRAVAAAAGAQAPAIYRLFGDKDGLLDAVAEHELARDVDGETPAVESDDPVAELHAAWRRHVRFGLDNPALYAVLADPARAARSPVTAAGLEVLRARVHRIAAAGRLAVCERRAVDLIHAAGTGAILTLSALAAEDRDPRLADALYAAVMRSVLADVPPSGADHVSWAAIALRAAAPELPGFSAGERALLGEWLERVTASRGVAPAR